MSKQHPANIAASVRQRLLNGTLSTELRAQGFRTTDPNKARYIRNADGVALYIDFLVDDGVRTDGAAMVDDIYANIMPGVARALQTARSTLLGGIDLFGAKQNVTALVCEVGPFLALKLRAFHYRQQPKDAFDILYTVQHYDGGLDAAIAGFGQEVSMSNPACPDALKALGENPSAKNSDSAGYGSDRKRALDRRRSLPIFNHQSPMITTTLPTSEKLQLNAD